MFGNDLFTGMPEWLKEKMKKKRLMESPITAAEAESMSDPFMQVNRVQPNTDYTAGGTIGNPTAGIGDIGYIPPGPASSYGDFGASTMQDAMRFRGQGDRRFGSKPGMPTPNQGYSGPVSQTGRPSVGMGKDFTGYTKSLDKTFMMAALQSAIPEDQPAPRGISGGGAHGGGNNLADMQPFLTGTRRKKRNPALWRYS